MHSPLFDLPSLWLVQDLMIPVGIILCGVLVARRAEREHQHASQMLKLVVVSIIAGYLGGHILYIFTDLPHFMENPLDILLFWTGGGVFFGGVIGVTLAFFFSIRVMQLPFCKTGDIMVPYFVLIHAIGRLHCFVGGCCFGKPTNLPLAVIYPANYLAAQSHFEEGLIDKGVASLPIHPAQLYEAGALLLLFLFLLWLQQEKSYHGQIIVAWFFLYPALRFGLEAFRGDKYRGVYILSISQYISIALLLLATFFYLQLRKKRLSAH